MTKQQDQTNPTILLVDNGSSRIEATLQLTQLAEKLSHQCKQKIHTVSLQHVDRISKGAIQQQLNGKPARIFREFMTQHLDAGQRDFIFIPLFFGKSRALSSFVPNEMKLLKEKFGSFNLKMTDVLYPLPQGEPLLVDILYEHAVISANGNSSGDLQNLVLVDHGSPLTAVNAVRQHIATALQLKFADGVSLHQAAMERRKGEEFDFNGELLADYLSRLAKAGETKATVLLLFLLAGTHAGEDGDIVQICDSVMQQYPNFKVSISPLVGQNERLITCLAQRLNQTLSLNE